MTHRLRRMVLVNARTSGSSPSGRIVEIDPRGGAAIVGANSVGKTSTLELLPLFLGHSPSDLSDPRAATGRQPMLQYVLPTPQSAIIFEYQRGPSEEHDLRFVCMRRAAGDIAPEYRLFKGPFRKDLFVKATPEAGLVFLDDVGSLEAARSLGVEYQGMKLDCASYRRVILAFRKKTEDEPRLRAISHDYCLGPVNQSLAHLDSLVAAVVKKHISFDDFRHIAVEMVQQELGTGSVGNQRTRLELRQGRQQIRSWLDDRDACADALAKDPLAKQLRELVHRHAKGSEMLQVLHGDAAAMRSAKQSARLARERSMNEAADRRKLVADSEAITLERLTQELSNAQTAHSTAATEFETQNAALTSFTRGGAAHWAGEMSKLPALEQTERSLHAQIQSAEETATKYAVEIANEEKASAELLAAQERRKQPSQLAFETAGKALRIKERARLDAHATEVSQIDPQRASQIATLQEQVASRQRFIAAPWPSAIMQQALDEANIQQRDHLRRLNTVNEAHGKAAAAAVTAKGRFDECERKVGFAQGNLEQAKEREQEALEALRPAPGTLLHTLRSHPNDAWRTGLAKILDPSLLKRSDMDGTDCTAELVRGAQAAPLVDLASLAFGFRLETDALPVPEWVDKDQATPRHEAAQRHAEQCKLALEAARSELKTASAAKKEADAAVVRAEAAKSLADAKTPEIEEAQHQAQERRASDLDQRLEQAKKELAQLKLDLQQCLEAQTKAQEMFKAGQDAIRDEFERLLNEAQAERDRDIAAIQTEIDREPARLAQRIASLQAQRDEQLRAEGVNMERLAGLRGEHETVTGKINAIAGKAPFVQAWRSWNEDVGAAGLNERKTAVERCAADLGHARTRLADHNRSSTEAQSSHDEAMQEAQRAISQLQNEDTLLEGLENQLQAFSPRAYLGAEDLAAASAEALRTRVRDAEREHREIVGSLATAFDRLKSDLTGRENAVQRLVSLKLLPVAGADAATQAAALLEAYSQIPGQIITDVNHTLGSVLAKVNQFHKDIQDFETEITSFNQRLQAGMPKVSGFPWLKQMRLNIVTNFSDLEYMGKLKALSSVAREHSLRISTAIGGADTTLPSDDAAPALRDFLAIIGADGSLAINLSSHVKLSGSMQIKGVEKSFRTEGELEHIDSNGITSIVLISLLSGMLNTIRKQAPLYISWVTDEVGKFDPSNFTDLMEMLRQNRIDVITASPELTPAKIDCFARCYEFEDQGRVGVLDTLESTEAEVPA
jgi:uncharacterized protein DUF3584